MNVIIGIGNEYRRDDGFGPAVIAALMESPPEGTRLTIGDGEPSGLLAAWSGTRLAILVDAVLCEPALPGRTHRTDLNEFLDNIEDSPAAGHSSHGLGVPEAVQLGMALGRLPERLIVLAVEAEDLGFGPGLSDPVAAALPGVLNEIHTLLAGR